MADRRRAFAYGPWGYRPLRLVYEFNETSLFCRRLLHEQLRRPSAELSDLARLRERLEGGVLRSPPRPHPRQFLLPLVDRVPSTP
jgi:hypothetical protein